MSCSEQIHYAWGLGVGLVGGGEPAETGEGHGIPSQLCHTAPTQTLASLIFPGIGLFPHVQNEISNNGLCCSYFLLLRVVGGIK